jgi:hypothetical protein
MGMNAILVYVCHGPAQNFIDAFYYATPLPGDGGFDHSPAQGALLGGEGVFSVKLLGAVFSDPKARLLAYVLLKLLVYVAAAWACAKRGFFWKI